ncbi:MAG: hypothetical protein M3Q89_14500 [Verrucomicrobiota bacterium]|nr:hypothetical protein [Verrucomicrobiota bacterium]
MSAALLLLPSLTVACTVCNTDTGQQVRGGIFGDDFWSTLLAVALPFPVLLLAQIHNMLSAICPPTSVPNIEINCSGTAFFTRSPTRGR